MTNILIAIASFCGPVNRECRIVLYQCVQSRRDHLPAEDALWKCVGEKIKFGEI